MTGLNLSLRELSLQLRNKSLRAEALMQECARFYTEREPASNAYKTWNGAAALAQAQYVDQLLNWGVDLGPLMGIPTSVKDLFGVPGLPIFAGSSAPLPKEWEQAGGVVQSLLKQAAIITGKTHTVEFAFGGIGINAHWGTPTNPWDAKNHRIPGGSSSGAGVSLLQGTALLALGTDTAGSVRIPASFTGTVALKLTQNRWPTNGAIPLSSTLDTPGILTRSVDDAIFAFNAMDSTISGQKSQTQALAGLGGVRVGVPKNFFWDGVDDCIVQSVQEIISKLSGFGANVTDTTMPGCDDVYEIFKAGGLAASELSAFLRVNMPEKVEHLDPAVQIRVEGAETTSSVEYLRRVYTLEHASARAANYFKDFDVLVTPTIAISAPTVAQLENIDDYRHANMMVLRNTSIANLMGLSGLSMPIGKDKNGIPIGLQLMAGPNCEEKLLAVAAFIENKIGKGSDILGIPSLYA